MKNKVWIAGGVLAFEIGLALLCAVLLIRLTEYGQSGEYSTLEKMAYDQSGRESVVYIKENGEYVPYLVLESDYDGNVRLLREYLLPEEMQYEPAGYEGGGGGLSGGWVWYDYGSYYEKSQIDKFLNTEFPKVFGDAVQAAIIDTTIEVTDMESYHEENWAEATHMIERKVFLLSAVELDVNFSVGYTMTKEGQPLKYFKNKEQSVKKAYKADGEAWPYWTRTPEIWETCTVAVIGIDVIGSAPADSRIGVRPAFCMDKDTIVKVNDNIIEEESVYIIELDNESLK